MADSLMRVEEAQRRVLDLVTRPDPARSEAVDVIDALGRVLAADAVAVVTLPPWDNSAMDGYAIRAADVLRATDVVPVELRVVGDAAAGGPRLAGPIGPGEAVRIATGAPLPPGADAIAQVEITTPVGESGPGAHGEVLAGPPAERVLVRAAVAPGTHVRRAGSDLRARELLLASGTAIGPAQVALLAGAGLGRVQVHRRPCVGVLATGDEVRATGEALGDSGIPDANGPGLRALVAAAGAEPLDLGIARDDRDDVLARLDRGIHAGADAIVVAGGVSVGPYDVVKAAFQALGSVELWRVAVQPGKPFALATVDPAAGAAAEGEQETAAATRAARGRGPIAGRRGPIPGRWVPIPGRRVLLFGLPGNPVSGFVTFELFVRPAIRAIAGRRDVLRPLDRGVLLDESRTGPGRRAYLRVTAERAADGAVLRDDLGRARLRLAKGPAGQGSHVLSALATADALAIVPEEVEVHPAGGPVDVLWLDAP